MRNQGSGHQEADSREVSHVCLPQELRARSCYEGMGCTPSLGILLLVHTKSRWSRRETIGG